MKYKDLEKIAQEGNLIIERYLGVKFPKTIYRFKGDDWASKTIMVQKWKYFCRSNDMPENQMYKITAKDFKNLKEAGAKEIINI